MPLYWHVKIWFLIFSMFRMFIRARDRFSTNRFDQKKTNLHQIACAPSILVLFRANFACNPTKYTNSQWTCQVEQAASKNCLSPTKLSMRSERGFILPKIYKWKYCGKLQISIGAILTSDWAQIGAFSTKANNIYACIFFHSWASTI